MTIRPKSPAALLEAVRMAKADPTIRFNVPGDFPMAANDVLALWERGVHARASRGLPALSPRAEQRLADLYWDACRINEFVGQRIRHTGCRNLLRDRAMKARYPHIDNQPRDW